MLLTIDPVEPESWLIGRVAEVLRRGGIVVLPTDTVYALVCSFTDSEAIRRLYNVKAIPPAKRLSILVGDVTTASRYARGISTPIFRVMRRVLPGPYTLIFQATTEVPKTVLSKRRTIGIRMPASPIVSTLLEQLGQPLLSTSVRNERNDFLLDPSEIHERFGNQVDLVVDGGLLPNEPSTIVDLTGPEPVVVRAGKGDVRALGFQ
jgi:tRNA threonylcarbamoyl adenosine modification protein (Sua5/YciO/YrdC/YwlC family)